MKGWRERAADVFAEQGSIAAKMKSAPGPGTLDFETFRAVSKTQKAIHLTFVTSRGLARNSYWNDVQSEVTLDDLFRE